MYHIPIKPMSVNEAWQGRRFKTKKYELYEQNCLYFLQRIRLNDIKKRHKYAFFIRFCVKNAAADLDNFVKPFLDILQKAVPAFNDSSVKKLVLEKEIVKQKEDEGIFFSYELLD